MKKETPIKIVPIKENGYHLFVKATINGKKANMILDTGSSETVFDSNLITKYVNGSEIDDNGMFCTVIGVDRVKSKTVKIAKMKFITNMNDKKWNVLDLSGVNESFEELGVDKVVGIIGGDILVKNRAIIDYGKGILTFNN